MQLFPVKIRQLWSLWEVRVVILLSLLLQIVLVIFGAQRKYTSRFSVMILVWSAYLTADWVATVALGNLASNQGNSEDHSSESDNSLQAFWAPFLLVHLGGPDTITSYALEDNELWLRHFLGLVVQVGVAFYVFLLSWSNKVLTFICIPMFITGIIKYVERNFALRSASTQHFKDSLLSTPDSCADFVNYINNESMVVPKDGIDPEDHYLVQGYFLFKRLEYFFAGRVLGNKERKYIYSVIRNKSAEDAFKIASVQLGFMYDVLYTKASIVYSRLGIFLRCISFFFSVFVLVFFSFSIDGRVFPRIDVFVTYLLLAGALLVEVYAFGIIFSSDWTKLWLIKVKTTQQNPIAKTLINHIWKFINRSHCLLIERKRWSSSIAQYNLLDACIREVQPVRLGVQKIPYISNLLEYRYITWDNVNIDLQEKIFDHLRRKGDKLSGVNPSSFIKTRDKLLVREGRWLKGYTYSQGISWCINDVEFDQSVLIWHIATDLYYHTDLDDVQGDANKLDPNCKISKCLSDYMLYLLVFCPSMLPKGNGEIRYSNTCDEAKRFFKETDVTQTSSWRSALLEYKSNLPRGDSPESLKGKLSAVQDGCHLVKQFKNDAYLRNAAQKWDLISEAWIELLVYAAHDGGWKEHGQQLRKGGELLTHVSLLMTHFGLSEQFVNTD